MPNSTRTFYLTTQGTKTTTDKDFVTLIKQIQRTRDPTALVANPKSKAPASISRLYFLPNSQESKDENYRSPCERAADVIAEFLGDGSSSTKYHVGKNGTIKGQTMIPTRDDLRGQVEIGDWITFDRGAEDDESSVWGTQYLVRKVYHESIEIADPGLKHKVTKLHTFVICRYKRSIPTPVLDVTKGKGVANYMKHQPLDGPMFVLTQGNAMTVIPWFFGGEIPEPLHKVLKAAKRPWSLQITLHSDTGSPDPQYCKVFSTKGFEDPLRKRSCCERFWPFLVLLLLSAIAAVYLELISLDQLEASFKSSLTSLKSLMA